MNSNEKVLRFANELYSSNREMLTIYNVQSQEVFLLNNKTLQEFLNNFVLSCDLDGIRRWEKIFNILADELLETLEYRQKRVLNRLVQQPPYTKIYLERMLSGLFGEDYYALKILNNNYIIKVTIETQIDGLYKDTIETLRQLVPANMVIEALQLEQYMHMYLTKHFTHEQLENLTYGELSQYAEAE